MYIKKNLTIVQGIKKSEGEKAFCTIQGCEAEEGSEKK
jgi:hypothetical protein